MSSGASSTPTASGLWTGRTSRHSTDCKASQCLHAVPIRAEVAVGKVIALDCSAARTMDGVVGVFTFQDVPARKFAAPGQPWATDPAFRNWPERRIFTDEVKYFGDMIGCVVARDHETAVQAARRIRAKYENLPPVLDRLAETGSTQASHAEFADHLCATTEDVVGATPETPPCRTFHGTFSIRLPQPESREMPCVTAWVDEEGVLTLVSASPATHVVRRSVAEALGVPVARVRVIKPAAGVVWAKQGLALEPAVAFLTQRLGGRPVCLNLRRDEVRLAPRSRTHPVARLELSTGVDAAGRMVTRELMNIAESGCHAGHGNLVCMLGGSIFRQFYGGEHVAVRGRSLLLNHATSRALSGSGVSQVLFALESHVDDIARQLGADPLDFRLRNMREDDAVDPLSGVRVRTSGFARCIEQGKTLCGWDDLRARYAEQEGPVRRGVGMASFVYPTDTGSCGFETAQAQMVLLENGSVRLEISADFGPEANAVFVQTAARVLGIPADRVRMGVQSGNCADEDETALDNTDNTHHTGNTLVSRQSCVMGRAVKRVALELREKILAFAARLLHRSARELRLDGALIRAGDEVCAQLLDIAKASHYQSGTDEPLAAQGCVSSTDSAFVYGATFAEVVVDIPGCRVEVTNIFSVLDCGTVLRPPLATAQVCGGMTGARGVALSENLRIDWRAGRAYSADRQEYRIAADSPENLFGDSDVCGSSTLNGNKTLSEPAVISQAPAVRNAVLYATGVGVNSLPLSPQCLFAAFKRAGLLA